ncbi:MAG: tyrosine--tRNA ligase [candidate division WOR-3 bacterium]|nr:tyrosine--tRNA ligase [candidate division WOR-3 bacterium]MCX7836911.1 tyrosine--tRNA ligase [candidate division WOR-3 bacterium]MDW8114654.1 tyrosine--tRNA ligase [candidate division WOR-3 bacterium]
MEENILEILSFLKRNVKDLLTEDELKERLLKKKKLRVKLGIDVTGPDIHLGFAVVLRKLKEFQDFGHIACLVIGDFTAKIGDPSGRSKVRPKLSDKEIKENMKRYERQIFKILDKEKTEFYYNSSWHSKLRADEIIEITSKYTVARLLERDDFSKRYKNNLPIYVHEFLYPIFQAYDSIAIKADIELGGEDQYWNLLVGRELMKEFNLEPQIVMTMPLLIGTDGKLKMSKSYNNYIGIEEDPKEMFGKIMSIPDELIIHYFQLCTNRKEEEIKEFEKRLKEGENPRDLKAQLAKDIVSIYHSEKEAEKAEEEFNRVFKYKELPSEIPIYYSKEKNIRLVDLLVNANLLPSKSEAKRKIREGGVYLNGERIFDIDYQVIIDKEVVIKVGKRKFLKVLPL